MIVIQVASDEVPDLEASLTDGKFPYTIGTEDRYFGDNDLVSIIIETTKEISTLIPLITAFLTSRRKRTININGVELVVSNPITESEKELIKRALG